MNEEDIRHHVRKQRKFYTQVLELAFLNVVLILAWLLFDLGHEFWPKYVMFFSILGIAIKAYQYGFFPMLSDNVQQAFNKLHFMSDDWEEDKVSELMGKKKPGGVKSKAASTPTKKASTKAAPRKTVQKKIVGRTKKSS